MLLQRLRQRLVLAYISLLRTELRLAPSEAQRLFALTLVIGAACGLSAVAFHLAIRFTEKLLIERALSAPLPTALPWVVGLPVAGGLVAGVLLRYVVPNARGSGIPQVKAAYATRGGFVRLRDAVGKFCIAALQIGSGASLGREGPTVHICAGVAHALGRAAGVSTTNLRRLIPVGAAAGIAAAFNAPIAAVTFTVEEIVGRLDQTVLSGLIIAAALAAAVERSILGEHPIFDVPADYGLHDPRSLVIYAAMGVVAAGVAVLFSDSLLALRERTRRAHVVPEWARPAIGGLVTGVLGAAFLLGGLTGVTGGGYATLGLALTGALSASAMVLLALGKLTTTTFSYGTGGAGGIFAPSLFIGGMLGGAFGALNTAVFATSDANVGAFALVGMGAVFAGVIRAPITSVLIIVEMTNGYGLILPLMVANMTAYLLSRRLRPTPIYEALLAQDGIHLQQHVLLDGLAGIRVDAIECPLRAPVSVPPTMSARELVERTSRDGEQEIYPVVDVDGGLLGIITRAELRIVAGETSLGLLVNATDLMRKPASITLADDLRTAFELMRARGLPALPVLDANGRLAGILDENAVAREYLRVSGASQGG